MIEALHLIRNVAVHSNFSQEQLKLLLACIPDTDDTEASLKTLDVTKWHLVKSDIMDMLTTSHQMTSMADLVGPD